MFAKSKQVGSIAVLLVAAVCLGAVVLPPNTTARAAAAGAVLPPAVIVEVDSTEDWQAVTAGPVKPQIAVLSVDASLQIGDFAAVEQAIEALDGILPAFYVRTDEAAVALGTYCKDRNLWDAYVVSDEPSLVAAAKSAAGFLYGVVDCRAGKGSLAETVFAVNACGARTAWIDSTDKSTVEYLQYRWLNVWSDGEEDAVLSGANGVVTEQVAVVATYLSMLPAGTVLRNPMLVAHRGLETKMLENSVSGMLAAYEAGADAVECDIQVSKDDRLVVMHDEDLLRTTNGAGEISAMLWDEIDQYQLTYPKAAGYKESIPLLDDFFQAIKGNGKVLIVELKTNDQRSAPLLKQLIDRYDVADQVVLITFFAGQMTPARRELPALSLGSLSYNPKTQTLEEVCKDAAARNVTINPNYGNLTDSAIAALALRGFSVYPWTYYDANALTNGYYSGCMGLTTSDVTFAAPLVEAIESMDLYSNRYASPQAVARTVSGEKKTVTAEIVATDMQYASEAGKIVAAENGKYPAVLRIAFTAYGKTFVLQEKTTISVTTYVEPQPEEPTPIEPTPEEPTPDPEQPDPEEPTPEPPPQSPAGGCGSAANARSAVGGITLLIGCILAGRRTVKTKKRFTEYK